MPIGLDISVYEGKRFRVKAGEILISVRSDDSAWTKRVKEDPVARERGTLRPTGEAGAD